MSGPRLSIIPAGAIFDRSLEPRDMQVLNLLGCYTDKAGWCRRSQVKMAKQLNCGRSSVQRSLERLCEAGWVEKKRPPWANSDGQPSNSYMYRVILDRDDAPSIAIDDDDIDDTDTYAPDANQEAECPPMGTQEQPASGHPGAQPSVGTGAHAYVGTKNDPLERPPIERERDARARDRNARFIVAFEQRWPTAASDDRQRTAYAAEGLTDEEQQKALSSIAAFLDHLKQSKRKVVPAGWKYLEDKRWELLEAAKPLAPTLSTFVADSPEAKAVKVLHDVSGRTSAFLRLSRQSDGSVMFLKAMTPQLAALAQAPDPSEWVELEANQAGAWERFLEQFFDAGVVRTHPRRGSRAPWQWPPSKEGKIYTATGPPPDALMTDDDFAALR